MSTNAPHAPGEFGEPPARSPGTGRGPAYYALKGVKALASLRLTVALFVFGIVLIFFGTLAQLEFGIWTVVDKYFYSLVVWVPTELIHRFLGVFWKEMYPAGGSAWGGEFPIPGGKLVGGLMVLNLLAAHALRFRLSWKRLGIFLIHGGILLLLFGEFVTREFAIEQRMTIDVGSSVNYTQDARFVEWVFVDKSDPKTDTEVTIPEHMLKKPNGRITHPDLPVDVEVKEFMVNSGRLIDLEKTETPPANPADHGLGLLFVAQKKKEISGLDTNQINFPAVYVTLYQKGTDRALGTYLGSIQLKEDVLGVDGKKYDMGLRYKRYYKPYRVYLDEFRFDRYMGTKKAKSYSSDVRVEDANGHELRRAHIAMNEPMRFAGETFYQGGFDERTEQTSILQVVKNPGWLIPYISCSLVGFGLIAHFGIYLTQFLRRKQAPPPGRASTAATPAPEPVGAAGTGWVPSRVFPWFMLGFAALFLLSIFGRMTPKSEREPYDLDSFARVPVLEGGRVKPLETVARVYMRTISHREVFEDEKGKTQPAIKWYADVVGADFDDETAPAWNHKVFRIDNDQVQRELKLERREGHRYSLNEIRPKLGELRAQAEAARMGSRGRDKKSDDDLTGAKMIDLETHIAMVEGLTRYKGLNPHGEDTLRLLPPSEPGGEWKSLAEFRDTEEGAATLAGMLAAEKVVRADPNRLFTLTTDERRQIVRVLLYVDLDRLSDDGKNEALFQCVQVLRRPAKSVPASLRRVWLKAALVLVPPSEAAQIRADVESTTRARVEADPRAADWLKMVSAYKAKNPEAFNAAVANYRATRFDAVPHGELVRARVEATYNRYAPFFQCTGLYVLGFVLAVVGFLLYAAESPRWAVALRRSAFLVLALTLVVHTAALFVRMYLMDRPLVFVTNLYSSAVFIGWGCVALCLVLERIFPIGIGNTVAAVLGLATTVVAHNLGTQDTMEMLEAVLDTNPWLATHVTTVTLGYTATFVAGFLAALYVFMLLGAVVRDSFESTGEPTVGALLAFGAATAGVVGVPLFFTWFMKSALIKFELVPEMLVDVAFWLVAAAGVMYTLAVMLTRVGVTGVDAHGKPVAGRVPGLAQPIASLALTPESGKILGQMIYGVVCFATTLSFIGTVLGGIWADQSWGRFWGWDPKENGAVLIVLWNALILHARWCGLVKDRGLAVLAIFGNTITAWSWFGTNQLGIGLHAYGFDSRLADGCFNFWVSQLFVLLLGAAIPREFWAGATRRAAAPPAGAGAPAPSANGVPSANGHHPSAPITNGQVNGQVNGHVNEQTNGQNGRGQSRRDRRKNKKR
jgi:ABC-type transport system involved in cytochrome c biogenesis permease subunit